MESPQYISNILSKLSTFQHHTKLCSKRTRCCVSIATFCKTFSVLQNVSQHKLLKHNKLYDTCFEDSTNPNIPQCFIMRTLPFLSDFMKVSSQSRSAIFTSFKRCFRSFAYGNSKVNLLNSTLRLPTEHLQINDTFSQLVNQV